MYKYIIKKHVEKIKNFMELQKKKFSINEQKYYVQGLEEAIS